MTGNSLQMKEGNRRQILRLIRDRECSRAELARRTGLSRAAVTILTDALLADGMILEGEAVRSGAGRRPTLLKLRGDAFVSVGVDLARGGCELMLTDFVGKTLAVRDVPYGKGAEETVRSIADAVSDLLREVSLRRVLGIAVSAPGPVSAPEGIILDPPGMALFHRYPIRRALSERLGLPVCLQKDTNALVVAEKSRERISGDVLFLLADHGLGCGLIREGALFGRDGMGCEIGHTTLCLDGPMCSCGRVGCAELYASIPAAVRRAAEAGICDDWASLVALSESGAADAVRILTELGDLLATVCLNALSLFAPRTIVLGGELTRAFGILGARIECALRRVYPLDGSGDAVRVIPSGLGKHARAYAAAMLVIEEYLMGDGLL